MILVFGTVCLDRVMRVPNLPEPGGYVGIESEDLYLGGEAANTANALKCWGADIELIPNSLGSGPDAETLEYLLRERELLLETPLTEPRNVTRTPICDIYVTPDGERTMFGRGFSDMELEISLESIPYRSGHLFTAEPNMSITSRRAVAQARRYGMRIYLMDFFHEGDTFGEGDFCQFSTDWVSKRRDLESNIKWVQDLVDGRRCSAILTDGARGLVFGSPDHNACHLRAFPAPKVVDSTGAGDTFRAGVLYGLEQGWPVGKCLAFGSAAGALACGYLGATVRVPTLEEIAIHIEENPDVAALFLALDALPCVENPWTT